MLNSILNKNHSVFWLLFHVALGFSTTLSVFPLILWFYIFLAAGLFTLHNVNPKNRYRVILVLMTYLGALELIARMGKASPFIPYEISKYIYTVLLLIGITTEKNTKFIGWVMLFLLFPAAFFDLSGLAKGYQPIAFNLLGPVNVALGIILLQNKQLEESNYISLLRILVYALVLSLIFTIIKTPKYVEIEFNLRANFSTTGGFGSNQVSSAFGLGLFVMFISWILKWRITNYIFVDIAFLLLFAFQGMLTFSRGGMLGAIIAIVSFILISIRFSSRLEKKKLIKLFQYIVLSAVALFGGFSYADNLTGGMLSLRYQGHTAGTAAGTKEQTLNNITSNRLDIFTGDLELWLEEPIFGVGVGASRYLRTKVEGVIAHVELSRLMAEHGILGLIYFILLLKVGYGIYINSKKNMQNFNFLNLSLFILAIFTTFHASMRTFITPLLISLSILTITPSKKTN